MKIDPIKLAYDRLGPGIKNTSMHYVEGRNIIIRCLARNAKRTEEEVVSWFRRVNIPIKDLDQYVPDRD